VDPNAAASEVFTAQSWRRPSEDRRRELSVRSNLPYAFGKTRSLRRIRRSQTKRPAPKNRGKKVSRAHKDVIREGNHPPDTQSCTGVFE